jgi:hypothetical protein
MLFLNLLNSKFIHFEKKKIRCSRDFRCSFRDIWFTCSRTELLFILNQAKDFDQSINIGYEDEFEEIVVNNNSIEWVFNFDLNDLIDSIDLTNAVDGDGDGVIEISPYDTDGNHELAALLDQHIGHCGGIEHQD